MDVKDKAFAAVKYRVFALVGACLVGAFGATTVSLDGNWRLDYFPQPNDGAVRTLPLAAALGAKTVKATVPGNCELDLVNAGLLPPMEVGLNVLKLRPYEAYQWLYTKTFEAPAVDVKAGCRATLVFGGIDTLADVFLNGEKIGESANMLIEQRFDVTKKVRPGANTVQVLLRPVLLDAQYATVGDMTSGAEPGADLIRYRKAAHMGGWDIFPRVLAQGLWRSVRFEVEDPVRLRECAWIVKDLNVKNRWAQFMFRSRVEAPFAVLDNARLRCTLSRNGAVRAAQETTLFSYHPVVQFGIGNVDLWWPHGFGEPALYDAVAEIVDRDGTVLARDARKVGIRRIELVRDDVYGPDRPGQFLFKVNDEPCYIRGSNWVPLDAFHGRDLQHLIPTLDMWKDLNCNMVRVWGGGVYEPDAFFDWCDANGMMVWQDFMTGCDVFPQDDAYARATREEILATVIRHRNHPSIALWSGNNENDEAFTWLVGPKLARDPNLDRVSRKTIPDVLFEYDLTRPYLPSSPYRSPDVVAGRAKPSELHLWGARAAYKVPYYTNSPAWFASEMGYHGCPNLASLKKMMTPGCVSPWTEVTNGGADPRRDFHWNDEWQLKACNAGLAPGVLRHGTRNSLMTNQAKILFGGLRGAEPDRAGRGDEDLLRTLPQPQVHALQRPHLVERARRLADHLGRRRRLLRREEEGLLRPQERAEGPDRLRRRRPHGLGRERRPPRREGPGDLHRQGDGEGVPRKRIRDSRQRQARARDGSVLRTGRRADRGDARRQALPQPLPLRRAAVQMGGRPGLAARLRRRVRRVAEIMIY